MTMIFHAYRYHYPNAQLLGRITTDHVRVDNLPLGSASHYTHTHIIYAWIRRVQGQEKIVELGAIEYDDLQQLQGAVAKRQFEISPSAHARLEAGAQVCLVGTPVHDPEFPHRFVAFQIAENADGEAIYRVLVGE